MTEHEDGVISRARLAVELDSAGERRFAARTRAEAPDPGTLRSPLPLESILAILEACAVRASSRVLIIGTGSVFLPSVVARLVARVLVVESSRAHVDALLAELVADGRTNVAVRSAARLDGWEEEAPFDVIIADGRSRAVAKKLRTQLAIGGRMAYLMSGERTATTLVRTTRLAEDEFRKERLLRVRTVSTLSELLRDMHLLDEGQLEIALRDAGGEEHLSRHLRQARLVDEADLLAAEAMHHGIGHASVERLVEGLDIALARVLPRTYLQHEGILPLKTVGNHLLLAVTDPTTDLSGVAQALHPLHLAPYLVSATDYRRLWIAIDMQPSQAISAVPPTTAEGTDSVDLTILDTPGEETEAHGVEREVQMLFQSVLLDAVARRATDIHLELGRGSAGLRLRIDGSLHPYDGRTVDNQDLTRLINVFKVRAAMNISERRLPQGGGIRLRAGRRHYDLRVQTQPTLLGENAVVRLLPQETHVHTIEDLGFPHAQARRYRRILQNPSGLVLVVGPTGSGKSTTLYGGLRLLADDGTRKVVTIEDPIEYTLPGVQQSQVNQAAGFSFAEAVRSFLRLDPDVMLIGEIRDAETAREAIRASQTGHLVLSTLHCSESTDAIERLVNLGQDRPSIATELVAVLAQRLAQRICRACTAPADPDGELLAEVFPTGTPNGFVSQRGRGCARCRGTGTMGRIAVVEFLPIDEELRRMIGSGATAPELRKIARRQGLVTMRDRALQLLLEGTIPLHDLPRFLSLHRMAEEG